MREFPPVKTLALIAIVIFAALPGSTQSFSIEKTDKSGQQTILDRPTGSVGDFGPRLDVMDIPNSSNIPHRNILRKKLPNYRRFTPPTRQLQLPPSNVGDFDHTLRKGVQLQVVTPRKPKQAEHPDKPETATRSPRQFNIFEDAKQNPYKYRDDRRLPRRH